MAYRTVRPLRVGGRHYVVGETLAEGCLLESRAKELLARGYIEEAVDSVSETAERAAEQLPEAQSPQSADAQPKVKSKKKAETAGDA